jgi:hypothetical protein
MKSLTWKSNFEEPQDLGLIPMVIEQSGAASAPTTSTPGC